MNPDGNPNISPSAPASLPPVPTGAAPMAPSVQAPASGVAQKMDDQVKALVAQYQQDPYKLSVALQQLKSQYLADTFHINTNSVEK